jgi:hypothetical protein
MMFTTPVTALAPYTAEPGPRITSMRSMSSREIGQRRPERRAEEVEVGADRPSIRTRTLFVELAVEAADRRRQSWPAAS